MQKYILIHEEQEFQIKEQRTKEEAKTEALKTKANRIVS
jgi:hypothetical protein